MARAGARTDGGFGTFLETSRDIRTRVPKGEDYHALTESVNALAKDEVRDRFVRLLEAINPSADCACSKLREVEEGKAVTCAYHASIVGWIVHLARELMPPARDS